MSATDLLSHPPVRVPAADFRDAAARLPGARQPRGSVVPRDTILQPHGDGVSVETPVVASVVATSAPWRVMVAVDARRLLDVCNQFRKIGALKHADDEFEISVVNGQFKIKFGTTAVSLPIL